MVDEVKCFEPCCVLFMVNALFNMDVIIHHWFLRYMKIEVNKLLYNMSNCDHIFTCMLKEDGQGK